MQTMDAHRRLVAALMEQVERGPAMVVHKVRIEISHKGAMPHRATAEVLGADAGGELSRRYCVEAGRLDTR